MPEDPSQLALWGALATDTQRLFVRQLVEYAAPLLDRVYETFPTYTLHNSEHARNVARNIAELLGPRVSELLPIEAALLILAAYYHDIGMVFSEEERHHLTADPEWNEFLEKNPEAFLELSKAAEGAIPVEIAEWFCRWRHADRVYVHLRRLVQEGPEKLKWGAVSLFEILGELCRSHGRFPNFRRTASSLSMVSMERTCGSALSCSGWAIFSTLMARARPTRCIAT